MKQFQGGIGPDCYKLAIESINKNTNQADNSTPVTTQSKGLVFDFAKEILNTTVNFFKDSFKQDVSKFLSEEWKPDSQIYITLTSLPLLGGGLKTSTSYGVLNYDKDNGIMILYDPKNGKEITVDTKLFLERAELQGKEVTASKLKDE